MELRKTVVQVTVLHPADDTLDGVSLARIAHETDEGDWLGASVVISSERVAPENVRAESEALGNDGSFFAD